MSTPQKYTVTEALQELKLLTKRIERLINETTFISTKKSDEKNNKDETQNASKNYQSIKDLINRRSLIKSAIMRSNATTVVEIGNKKYTVSDVISHKEYISEQEQLLEVMKRQYQIIQEEIVRYNTERQRKVDQLIQTAFGRDLNSKSHSNVDDIKNITDTYFRQYNIEIVDPIKLKEKIDELEEEIESFKNTCDFKLSYINAVTIIEI